jgi:predicted transcriptional regulator
MSAQAIETLPRREREIFEIVCSAGEATAAAVRAAVIVAPSQSARRTQHAPLEAEGVRRHRRGEQSYVYRSVPQPAKVRESALRQMVKTFFDGSAANAATALLGLSKSLNPEEIEALQRAIDDVKERGK